MVEVDQLGVQRFIGYERVRLQQTRAHDGLQLQHVCFWNADTPTTDCRHCDRCPSQHLADLQVRALLEGKDIPQNGQGLDVVIKHYEEFVEAIKNKQYLSLYVYPKDVVSPLDRLTVGLVD